MGTTSREKRRESDSQQRTLQQQIGCAALDFGERVVDGVPDDGGGVARGGRPGEVASGLVRLELVELGGEAGVHLVLVGHVGAAETHATVRVEGRTSKSLGRGWEALVARARGLALAGRLDEALRAYEQHAASHGGGHRSHYFYGQALAAAGRPAEAAREFALAAADPGQRLPPEEAWYRALARVKRWRYRGQA